MTLSSQPITLNVAVTGETDAGNSIIIGAPQLLLREARGFVTAASRLYTLAVGALVSADGKY
jgi:hypothetical protein